MRRIFGILSGISAMCLSAWFSVSCIESSVPAPFVQGDITAFEVEGQISSVLKPASRTIEIVLEERVDIDEVKISSLGLTDGAVCELDGVQIAPGSVIDLTEPRKLIVRTNSGFEWTVSAAQTIEYFFEVEGQLGRAYFEPHSYGIHIYVPKDTDVSQIRVKKMKLWPEGLDDVVVTPSRILPADDGTPGEPMSFVKGLDIEVRYRDVKQMWHIYMGKATTMVDDSATDPWSRWAYVAGFGNEADGDLGFEYCRKDAAGGDSWTRVPESMVTRGENGNFSALISGLEPETDYFVRTISGDNIGPDSEFRTTAERSLPGGGFEDWHRAKDPRNPYFDTFGTSWSPWPEGALASDWEKTRWWDTGNKGVVAVAAAAGGNSLPESQFITNKYQNADKFPESIYGRGGSPANPAGEVAVLMSTWAAVKAAGGNIYFGEFGDMIQGGNFDATCKLGHVWTDKPTGLKFWYKYFPQPIDEVSAPHAAIHPWKLSVDEWMGSADSLHVCVALWASPDGLNKPFVVNTDTRPGQFLDFARDVKGVIAYGAFKTPKAQTTWAEQTITMEYLKDAKGNPVHVGPLPKNTQLYLLITASKNCNYFIASTGRNRTGRDRNVGSIMYVDEVELTYDFVPREWTPE